MFLRHSFLAVLGISFGFMVAGGVITVLIAVGLIPRFAGKLHVNKKVFLFEEAVVFGTLFGSFVSVFDGYAGIGGLILRHQLFGQATEKIWEFAGNGFLLFGGVFAGIFVGCLALAIAEMLDTIPIFARRIGFRHGIGIVILAIALGKTCGSLLYFARQLYLYGGQ